VVKASLDPAKCIYMYRVRKQGWIQSLSSVPMGVGRRRSSAMVVEDVIGSTRPAQCTGRARDATLIPAPRLVRMLRSLTPTTSTQHIFYHLQIYHEQPR
jgi:hypothetical protein